MSRNKYIIKYGVCIWGITTWLVYMAVEAFIFSGPFTIFSVIVPMLFFPAYGFIIGKIM